MRKFLFIIPLLALTLSGCSLVPKKTGSNTNQQDVPGLPSATIQKGSIWRSGDGGKVFVPQSTLDDGTSIIATADILSLVFHPDDSQVIYASTTESGVFKTTNGGGMWQHINFPPKNIYSFTLDRAAPDTRMFATGVWGGIGKIFRTLDGGANWSEVYSEPGEKTLVTALSQHFRDTNVIFAGTSGGTVVKSTDRGETWRNIGEKIDGSVIEIAFDSHKSFFTYLLSKNLYHSSDGGKHWIDWEQVKKEEMEELKKQLSDLKQKKRESEIKALEKRIEMIEKKNKEEKTPSNIVTILPSPFVSGTIFAGTSNGGLYKSEDFGKYWKELNIIESAEKFPIRALTVSHANRNEISFVAGRAFYKSLNNGETWSVAQLNADRPISAVAYDPKDSNVLFIGLRKMK